MFFVEDGFAGCDLFCVLDSPRLTSTCGRSHANARRLPPSNVPPLIDLPFPPALPLTLTYSCERPCVLGVEGACAANRVQRRTTSIASTIKRGEGSKEEIAEEKHSDVTWRTIRRLLCVFSFSLSPPRGRPLDGLIGERDTPDTGKANNRTSVYLDASFTPRIREAVSHDGLVDRARMYFILSNVAYIVVTPSTRDTTAHGPGTCFFSSQSHYSRGGCGRYGCVAAVGSEGGFE